ncbi:MAG: S1 RNA-binding domain-containing protein, partial [Stellaceae bacterium]
RYRTRLLGGRIGEVFAARVNGVQRFGLFLTLPDSGADGLLPIANLPPDFYRFDARRARLSGHHSRRSFGFGDALSVRLAEADPLGGRLVFRLDEAVAERPRFSPSRRRKRPARQVGRRR